jgi:hypothetical protein
MFFKYFSGKSADRQPFNLSLNRLFLPLVAALQANRAVI